MTTDSKTGGHLDGGFWKKMDSISMAIIAAVPICNQFHSINVYHVLVDCDCM